LFFFLVLPESNPTKKVGLMEGWFSGLTILELYVKYPKLGLLGLNTFPETADEIKSQDENSAWKKYWF
jgi:hypothetical protein